MHCVINRIHNAALLVLVLVLVMMITGMLTIVTTKGGNAPQTRTIGQLWPDLAGYLGTSMPAHVLKAFKVSDCRHATPLHRDL